MLTSGRVKRAFELDREDPRLRDRYGRHMFGQSLLLSRRLIQAGVPIVQANMGHMNNWDTHTDNCKQLKTRLLPPLDQAVSAFLDDLEAHGLLEETLVVMVGEFGRTPKIGQSSVNDPAQRHGSRPLGRRLLGRIRRRRRARRPGDRPVRQDRRLSGHAGLLSVRPGGDDLSCARRSIRPARFATSSAGPSSSTGARSSPLCSMGRPPDEVRFSQKTPGGRLMTSSSLFWISNKGISVSRHWEREPP